MGTDHKLCQSHDGNVRNRTMQLCRRVRNGAEEENLCTKASKWGRVQLCLAKMAAAAAFLPLPIAAQDINPFINQSNIQSTICTSGWSAASRPPVRYTNKVKLALMDEEGFHFVLPSEFELDHWIPIELGGNPTSWKNLTLQAWPGPNGAHEKDKLENMLHREVCAGRVSLKDAQSCMAIDWHSCLKYKNSR